MILIAVAVLIAESADRVAAQLCALLEVCTEVIRDFFQVRRLTEFIIRILEFIVTPAQRRSGVTLRQTELYMVTRVMEAIVAVIAGMAVAAPVQRAVCLYAAAAHVRVVQVHAVLQELCVIVIISSGNILRYDRRERSCKCSCRDNGADQNCFDSFSESEFIFVQNDHSFLFRNMR